MSYNNYNRNNEENLFSAMFYRYLPFWPLFVGLFIFFVGLAWAYMHFYATPLYEATATIIIKDQKKGVDDSEMVESINAFGSKKIVENEIDVIQSRDLMKQVVNELHLYATFSEDKGFKTLSAYTTSPISVELKNTDRANFINSNEETAKHYFSYNTEEKKVILNEKKYSLDEWHTVQGIGEVKFFKNENQTASTDGDIYFSLVDPRIVTADLLNRLNVISSSKLSTVVNIDLKDPVPGRAEDILNNLIKVYNGASVADRNALAKNTLDFIEERMNIVENELEYLDQELQQYRYEKGVTDLGEQGKLYLQDVGIIDRQIADIRLQLDVLNNVERYVVAKGSTGGIVPSTLGINDVVLAQLLEKLYDAEIEYERLRMTTAENNPILVSISNEIKKIRPGILENVANQRANLQSTLQSLSSTNSQYNSTLKTLPEKERALAEISRRKAEKNDLFLYLLQKREETALSFAPTNTDSRVVDVAEATVFPVNPKAVIIYPVALIFAFALGIGYIVFKELFTNKILFRDEIEKYTNVPILGELSYSSPKGGAKKDDWILTEQLRDLRLALRLYGESGQKKKILITSGMAGEGKSFVSENMGYNLASSNKKVLLIDFDLRNAQTSKTFNAEKKKGIAEFLNNEVELSDVIQTTKHKNLFILPAGNASESTLFTLLNKDLQFFFSYLEEIYDYIIIDTPPVGVTRDAYFLSNHCDISLYVLRHNRSPKKILEQLHENLRALESHKKGIIFNGVRSRGFMENGYGYGYHNKNLYRTGYTMLSRT